MVDNGTLSERLLALKKQLGLSYAKFGELGGKSTQAAFKWVRGGGIEDETLRTLCDEANEQFDAGVDFYIMKYGREREDLSNETELDRQRALDVYDALSREFQETWISIGNLLIQRHAEKSRLAPFAGVALKADGATPKAQANGKGKSKGK